MLKLETKSLATRNHLSRDSRRRREVGEEEEHGKTVVEVAQSVNESGISFSDDMVESISRFACLLGSCSVALEATRIGNISTTQRSRYLLFKDLLLAELL